MFGSGRWIYGSPSSFSRSARALTADVTTRTDAGMSSVGDRPMNGMVGRYRGGMITVKERIKHRDHAILRRVSDFQWSS
jgi:hypothetical protein